jgi:septal ring factor EnvC (AmiA/AmiB activator)
VCKVRVASPALSGDSVFIVVQSSLLPSLQDATTKVAAELQQARTQYAEEKAQLVASSGRSAAALQADLSSCQSQLAAATASIASLQEHKASLVEQLADIKLQLEAKATAAENSGNKAAEVAEALKASERREHDLKASIKAATDEHAFHVAGIRQDLSEKISSLEGVAGVGHCIAMGVRCDEHQMIRAEPSMVHSHCNAVA